MRRESYIIILKETDLKILFPGCVEKNHGNLSQDDWYSKRRYKHVPTELEALPEKIICSIIFG
jgi:hypothetical protein